MIKSELLPKEAVRLHKQNWAIHWLRPFSKVPVESGWSKGPRLEFKELKDKYQPGFNPGVRLGRASKIENTYLAVLDIDVKSKKPAHYDEAINSLYTLYPQTKEGPFLLSGRGQGSSHYYVRIKEPVSGNEIKARSTDVIKVTMPSVKPSKLELKKLTKAELDDGLRLRPAWEIQLLSNGRQAAIVGAIHPDTGKRYKWGKKVNNSAIDIPIIEPEVTLKGTPSDTERPKAQTNTLVTGIEIEDVDVNDLGLKTEHVQAIVDGIGVYDRSAKVYSLCMTMLRIGVSEAQIRGVFTDPDYYLGQTAFDHAKTKSRKKAALWFERYCLKKAREKVEATTADFDFDIEELPKSPKGHDINVPKPNLPMGFDGSEKWAEKLSFSRKGKVSKVLKTELRNVKIILENSGDPLIRRNSFALKDIWAVKTPWGSKKGTERSGDDVDSLKIKLWFAEKYGIEPSTNIIDDALTTIASDNSFHPVQNYLNKLKWDGIERVDNCFKDYLGAIAPEPYLSEVTRKFFAAAVKRAFEPGCKFDHVVVLEGSQGIGKSTFGEMLASPEWFLDGLPNFADKDAALYLQGCWLCEISELAAMYKSANESTKAFIARNTDKFRPPYGRIRQDFPRTTIFLGTTNDTDYLTDPTGNRRFWPVEVTKCDFKEVAKVRDQLWAEAMFNYTFDPERLWLEGKAKEQAVKLQSLRMIEDETDIMAEKFLAWIGQKNSAGESINILTVGELFNEGPFNQIPMTMAFIHRAGRILRKAGYIKSHTKNGNVWKINKKA